MKNEGEFSNTERWRLLENWERLREGEATAEEAAEIHERMTSDPEARRWLAQAVLIEAALRYDGSAVAVTEETELAQPEGGRWWNGVKWSHAAAAAVAALVTWGVWEVSPGEDPAVATLVRAQSCKWGNSALPTMEGSALSRGTLELVEGMATLRFKSGAEVVMEAPVSLEVVSAMEARVTRGTVVAEVPPQAKGFTIQTPQTRVVDFGTKFGVSAGEDGKCLVHVIDGLVEVQRDGEREAKALRGGERLDYGGLTQDMLNPDSDRQTTEPGRWMSPAAMRDLGDGWQVITTAFGRGRDTWIQSNPRVVVTGKETFLRAKHTTLDGSLERKIYLAFDLSETGGRVAEAELLLHLEPSDLGYGSLVPDAVFKVFGVKDGEGDFWEEDALDWSMAPAHSTASEHHSEPVAGEAELLGEFVVEQGRQSGAVRVGGGALAEFLRRDTNGVATLIICRVTDETARNGLVHAFASRENSSNAPPMIRLRVERE